MRHDDTLARRHTARDAASERDTFLRYVMRIV